MFWLKNIKNTSLTANDSNLRSHAVTPLKFFCKGHRYSTNKDVLNCCHENSGSQEIITQYLAIVWSKGVVLNSIMGHQLMQTNSKFVVVNFDSLRLDDTFCLLVLYFFTEGFFVLLFFNHRVALST